MKISDVDTSQNEFTDAEMDALVDILTKAKEITDDKALYNIVQKHMDQKTKKYKSVADLRAKANEIDMTPDDAEG